MTETRRAFASDLEIRGDGRELHGLVAPFDTPTPIVDFGGQYVETIRRGAFKRTIAERGAAKVKLLAMHAREALPIGRATNLVEDTAGLVGQFRVSKTTAGDEVLELTIRDGSLDGLSIGFRVLREDWSPGRTERTLHELRLDEVSVVAFPPYESARVLAVRSATSPQLLAVQRQLQLLERGPQWTFDPM